MSLAGGCTKQNEHALCQKPYETLVIVRAAAGRFPIDARGQLVGVIRDIAGRGRRPFAMVCFPGRGPQAAVRSAPPPPRPLLVSCPSPHLTPIIGALD